MGRMGDSGHEESEEDEEDERGGEDFAAKGLESEMDSEDADSENEEVDQNQEEMKNFQKNRALGSDEELVRLVCDLPSWETTRSHLEAIAR